MRSKENKNVTFFTIMFFLFITLLHFASCSFDYSPGRESEKNRPDIVMEDIEYVRMRRGDPLVRFEAEYAERWEERQIMEFKKFSFEQMEGQGETINASGGAGAATVQTGSGDIALSDGVMIDIKSEDIIIKTSSLEWIDKEKHLLGGENEEVRIESTEGTSFLGFGFSADARNRTWAFSGKVEGHYVESDDDNGTGKENVKTIWLRHEGDVPRDQTVKDVPRRQVPREALHGEMLHGETIPDDFVQRKIPGEYTPEEEKAILKTREDK